VENSQFSFTLLDPSTCAVKPGGAEGAVVSVLAADVVGFTLLLAEEWFWALSKATIVY
jgi:hypothetical protein